MGRFDKPKSGTAKPPVAEILKHYGAERVPETLRGWAVMRCPFHADSSASASVNTVLQTFKCHACNFGGDSFALVEWRENTGSFPDTIAAAEAIIGYSLRDVSKSASGKRRRSSVFEPDARPVRGQTSIFQTRVR